MAPRVCEQRSPGPETPKRFGVEREGLGGAAQTRCLAALASGGPGENAALAGGLAEGMAEPSLNGTEGFVRLLRPPRAEDTRGSGARGSLGRTRLDETRAELSNSWVHLPQSPNFSPGAMA